MSLKWKKLKSEIVDLVADLKAKIEHDYKEEVENSDIQVLVKFKDNAKDALITIVYKKNLDIKPALSISLANCLNLPKRFESFLADFKNKIS
ncbi:MAG: hypothetical protein WA160_05730 [Pseudobdellovibrio sp.]